MSKIAFVFPGQGSQYVGMGKDIYENYESAKRIFDTANEELDIDLKEIMFNGPEEELTKTENTQPAILTLSTAITEIIKENTDINVEGCAGLSLGEYSAMVYSGAFEFKDAVSLVKKRGRFMQEAVPAGKGTMAAILGLDRNVLIDCLNKAKEYGIVEAANFNCPGQIVISGEIPAIEKAVELCKESGAKKAVILKVSAPFHSSMLKPAGEKLSIELDNIAVKSLKVPVISNVSGDYIQIDNIKESLIKQVSSSVLWEDSVERFINDGFDTFVEIGSGKTLKPFIKKVASKLGVEVNIFNVENSESLQEFIKIINGGM